ncbi:hypothetical protein F751_3956 [Auxenochlorella protothecoides]|uniref:Uncharacterized protein n=1 Tax=Auxenochlorella protothecoides TaxID=3075 RepID=A0A087SHS2_AUXPR|nr:hypothetical protein F751_3956 [Auxenochlorella protothecoides]KFM25276.1 hypothetical protein F751_3956 [Auxenochlorella protothecoides]
MGIGKWILRRSARLVGTAAVSLMWRRVSFAKRAVMLGSTALWSAKRLNQIQVPANGTCPPFNEDEIDPVTLMPKEGYRLVFESESEEGSNRIYTCLPDLTVSYTPFTANVLFGGSEYDAAWDVPYLQYIVRSRTEGGVPPASCTEPGKEVLVPFRSHYSFYSCD